ncbi:DUF1980 domain-containing protein [Microbacterium sp. HA-8]|uniref:TIGR03943 family putative permease subunit n=1 Tax=Microbacterium sp. HA-8 TaxID=3234200 RepID=UPI0038F69C55
MRDRWTGGRALGLRWLGVGLASALAVVTLGLWATGRIGLYINPDAAWWVVSMSILLLVVGVASCAVPISRDEHDHAGGHAPDAASAPPASAAAAAAAPPTRARARDAARLSHRAGPGASHPQFATGEQHDDRTDAPRRAPFAAAATAIGAVISTVFVTLAVALPPASLSAELALARSTGAPPVLSTSATLALASSDDTSSFGVGEWASVLATTTDPARFVGEPATLVGFVAPGEDGTFDLTRLVIVHCVIDAQAASVPVTVRDVDGDLEPGQWVEVSGEFARQGGGLVLQPASVQAVAEPGDPYEY